MGEGLAFYTGSAILKTTMTDKLHYQDVFQTINIPKPERRLALKAKNLFDVTNGVEPWNPNVYEHLRKTIDTENASQAFWEFENDNEHTYDQLVLTMMRRGLTIALEHRDFTTNEAPIRKSLFISGGVSKVYVSELRAQHNLGVASEQVVTDFKESFFQTTARLGLYTRTKHLQADQNESSSDILASAA